MDANSLYKKVRYVFSSCWLIQVLGITYLNLGVT